MPVTNRQDGDELEMKSKLSPIKIAVLIILAALSLPLPMVSAPESDSTEPSSKSSTADAVVKLADGLYLVLRKDTDRSKIEPIAKGETLLINDYRFLEPADRGATEYVVVQTDAFVPLIMKDQPEKGTDTKGRPKLLISLAEDQSGKLEEFTRKNTGGSVAVVIGDQVVSCHKIREPIVGGRMQITRCTDNGCAAIYSELQRRRHN